MPYYMYFMSNQKYGVIYTGVTNDLVTRVTQHRSKVKPGFTKKYNCTRLVYFEPYDDVRDAIHRENASRNGSAPGRSS